MQLSSNKKQNHQIGNHQTTTMEHGDEEQ